ncbi:MAG TPA: GNAT family N-acetyltransferase [Ktedonobacteraceae bacterium]|nr:GNAT family N-acetyltransferase [Ktedonobacteraceae bacterium]
MSENSIPPITLRALQPADAEALYNIDYSFETDRIYKLRAEGDQFRREGADEADQETARSFCSFKLVETPVYPPFYKNYRMGYETLEAVQARLQQAEGGYVVLVDGKVDGGIFLKLEAWRSLARIEDVLVGRQSRRYGIGSLLLDCAADWARNRNCRAILLETQNTNYPAIQFYLRNGFEIWGINQHFYPPGPFVDEIALFLGKRLR